MPRSAADPGESRPGPSGVSPVSMEGLKAPARDAVLMLGTPSSRYSLEPELAPPKEISTALDVSYGLTSFSKCFCLGMTPSALRANASGVFRSVFVGTGIGAAQRDIHRARRVVRFDFVQQVLLLGNDAQRVARQRQRGIPVHRQVSPLVSRDHLSGESGDGVQQGRVPGQVITT